ncbi:EFR1 family ferrodoxin [Christensenellaceae bacterium OttesenSCG-928-K19]|nr:EFR1 family ferrodoxin [Christensenellaceae bacterium OttesenSCG-928-K19]
METYGGVPGNTISQADELLQGKGATLSYGKSVRMFANYIALYPMKGNVEKKARKAEKKAARVALDVTAKIHNAPFRQSRFFAHYHTKLLPGMLRKVEQFNISDACIGCGKCVRLCPDKNIYMENGRPVIGDNCEQCMACIQWCPAQAINYLDKTGGAKYHHPAVTVDELMVR